MILFTVSSIIVFSQEIVLDKNVDGQYHVTYGPNLRHFVQSYTGFGFIIPYSEEAGAGIVGGRSVEFITGTRYKLKILPFYSIGVDLSYRYMRYGISDEGIVYDDANPLTTASTVDKFLIGISSLGFEAFNRINVGRRGNILGNYIDIGLRWQWNYAGREKIKDTPDNVEGKIKTVRKGTGYIREFSKTAAFRVGYNKFILFGDYNLSGLFEPDWDLPELPPLSLGLQIAF